MIPNSRILSIDQFRGFTVLMMFVVNFLQGKKAIPSVFQHNENWVSIADWIMPAFLFLVGMAFRLTWQKRIEASTKRKVIGRFVRRSLALMAVSLILYGFGSRFGSWQEWNPEVFFAALLKARLWEVLAIIGASQLLILPVIGLSTRVRAGVACLFMLTHLILSGLFNVHFVLAQPNPLDAFWGAADVRAWDGGFFGVLSWASIALIGSIAMDGMQRLRQARMIKASLISGAFAMLLGWGLSCVSTCYDVGEDRDSPVTKVAAKPVIPPFSKQNLSFGEPPFTPIPDSDHRQINYWMMSKRLVSLPYVLFATGCTSILLALFMIACDRFGFQFSIFRILGTNALAAYLIHQVLLESMKPLFPKDAPLWFILFGLAIFLTVLMFIMRFCERQKLYLRL
ncbi:heparan-alpha-glucosaminide N-acetyltransferase domain-containing protein [bacterium]|nr:heparan-alpha-glucosaminide N-acetyltransferase domain-containing protein [bacterium]